MEKTVGNANLDHHPNSLPGFSPTSANLAYETDGFLGWVKYLKQNTPPSYTDRRGPWEWTLVLISPHPYPPPPTIACPLTLFLLFNKGILRLEDPTGYHTWTCRTQVSPWSRITSSINYNDNNNKDDDLDGTHPHHIVVHHLPFLFRLGIWKC